MTDFLVPVKINKTVLKMIFRNLFSNAVSIVNFVAPLRSELNMETSFFY